MKKIMFNDRYGLTKAVLEGRKTMTRRIITDVKVMQYLLESEEDGTLNDTDPDVQCIIDSKAKYKVGEVVAVAQSYKDVMRERNEHGVSYLVAKAGYTNKMFVRAELMPHKIRIADIRIERIQDISDEDCLKEGLLRSDDKPYLYGFRNGKRYETRLSPKEAFAILIDRVSGKETWKSNPFVFVYEYDLFK